MGRVVDNPKIGRLKVVQSAASTGGALVVVHAGYRPGSQRPPAHYHPRQEERFRIVEGEMTAVVDSQTRRLRVGEQIVLPAGTVHQMWNSGADQAAVVWETRPALRTEDLLVELWSSRNVLHSLLAVVRYRAELRLVLGRGTQRRAR